MRNRRNAMTGFSSLAFILFAGSAAQAQILAPNLVFTSIQPCRVFDTRLATNGTNGRLVPNVAQTFNVVGNEQTVPTAFTGQGGHPGGCSIPGFSTIPGSSVAQVQAVVFNFVAVSPLANGDMVAWPTDQPQPTSSIINYPTGISLANGLVLPVRQDIQGGDITLKAQVGGAHVVADVVGYFSSNNATLTASELGNVFLGHNAGNPNSLIGGQNTAMGEGALASDTFGALNTAFGNSALMANTTGSNNTAVGQATLNENVSGIHNTAVGAQALLLNQIANDNTAVGFAALSKATAVGNTAVGAFALGLMQGGISNIAIGDGAGFTYSANESNNILIANSGVGGENGTLRIGTNGTLTSAVIAGIAGATSTGGVGVFITSGGRLGTVTSSARFKEDIADMDGASEGLMQLRPVTFHYRPAYDDGSRLLQYGLIAEEVAAVFPGLVQYGEDGQATGVRYHFVNAMLLNEVQKQHRAVESQQKRLDEQAAGIASQRAALDAAVDEERRGHEALRQQLEARLESQQEQIERLERVVAALSSRAAGQD